MTLLLKKYFPYTLFLSGGVNVGEPEQSLIKMINRFSGEEYSFSSENFNVEMDRFPYPDNSFDVVLCCELIEHLDLDPTYMLAEIHRILKPGGRILITTPNVLVLRNLVSMLRDRKNIYYPYSGYGVYGRHNREWTLEELVQLVSGCGFDIEKAYVADTYPHRGYSLWLKRFFPHLRDMLLVLGCAKDGPATNYYPENLYESLPKQYKPENPIPSRLQKL
jgi:SAM-dependent methyltransferase